MQTITPPNADDAIAVEGVTKRYRSARGVEDVTLTVARGERFGLLGPNGSGKTTLIRLFLRLLHPDAGSVRVAGHDVARDRSAALGEVGYLPGELAFVGGLSGAAALDVLAALHPRPARLRDELCDVLGLSSHDLSRPVRQYSRGMKQKVGLVAALQHDPPVAILDEPTGGLDPVVQMRLLDWLKAASARGTTVVLSSHVISEVEHLCDRVAMMGEGRLIALREVSGLALGSTRVVRARFATPTDPASYGGDAFDGLAAHNDSTVHTFEFHGPPDRVLAMLAAAHPIDVEITPLSLEDAVRRLYVHEDAQ